MRDLYWAETTATWQKIRQNDAFLEIPKLRELYKRLACAQGLKSKSYIKETIVVEIIKNLFMNAYVSAIATPAVVSDTARIPLYTVWNVYKIRKFFWYVFSHIQTEYGYLRSKYQYQVRILENTD